MYVSVYVYVYVKYVLMSIHSARSALANPILHSTHFYPCHPACRNHGLMQSLLQKVACALLQDPALVQGRQLERRHSQARVHRITTPAAEHR